MADVDNHSTGAADQAAPQAAGDPDGKPADEPIDRSTGPWAAEWDAAVPPMMAALLQAKVESLLDGPRVAAAVAAAFDADWLDRVTRPALEGAVRLAVARLQARPEAVTELVPEAARRHLEAIAADPNLVSAPLVSELLQDPAVESVIHDVLFDALRQFSHRINPFTADWGLPALLKLLPPIGFGGLRSAFEARRAEFEQRIEPEIRRFLAGFTRRAVQRLAELVLRKQQEPEFVALRQRMLGALLRRPLSELLWTEDDPKTGHLLAAVHEILRASALHELVQAEARALVEELLAGHGQETLGILLGRWGVGLQPGAPQPLAFAQACYPAVAVVAKSRAG